MTHPLKHKIPQIIDLAGFEFTDFNRREYEARAKYCYASLFMPIQLISFTMI